jgi:alginate O-acetyltransferase complex protein AlgI
MITSPAFWAALAVAALLAYRLPRRRDLIVALASAAFIACHDPRSLVVVAVLSTAAYLVSRRFSTGSPWPGRVVILVALAALAAFKYAPPILHVTGVAIPLGISYFTFKLVHYLVDSRRQQIPEHRPESFASYMLFFPMFSAGPIARFDDFLRDRAERVTRAQLIEGGTRIAYGLIKKLVIVNLLLDQRMPHDAARLGEAVPFVFPPAPIEHLIRDLDVVHPLFVWQFVVHQFTTWYLDFSAYSDVAIGAGLLLGIKLGENFDWPLLSPNPTEFWKRYHMSLSAWCQRYVYMPVIGWTRSPYLGVFATMGAMGLWHAGSLNYVGWGIYHATILAIYLTWGRIKRKKKWKPKGTPLLIASTLATSLLACASAVFPATSDYGIATALKLLGVLVGVHVA